MISPATWTTRHLQALVAALGRLLRRPLGALLTTLVIAVALALPAGLWLLVQNARSATGDLATAVQVSAFLKVGTSVERAQELATAVRGQPGIATVTLITAEQGLKEFRERSDFGKALDALESNPLPHTLVIQPTTVQRDAAALERLRGTLAGWPEVEIVQADTEWAQRLAALLAVLRTLFLASAVLFGLGVLAVIGNTTRVEIAARLPEIAVTKLVGGCRLLVDVDALLDVGLLPLNRPQLYRHPDNRSGRVALLRPSFHARPVPNKRNHVKLIDCPALLLGHKVGIDV
jgi:cell division transport system permease protein